MSEISKTEKQHAQQQQQSSISIYGNQMNVIPNYTLSGMSSFDAESLPDYSEFDSESVTLDYYKERYLANDDNINNGVNNNKHNNNGNPYFFCIFVLVPFHP